MSTIYGNMVGGAGLAQIYILEDSDGKQVTAVVSDEPVVLDATVNDVREGKTFASESGVKVGEKVIPAYHTNEGVQIIPAGSSFVISSLKEMDLYDFTKLQAIICDYNTSLSDSVSANKVSINERVYAVETTVPLSTITKNSTDKTVEFGITNSTDKPQILRFITYKEIE